MKLILQGISFCAFVFSAISLFGVTCLAAEGGLATVLEQPVLPAGIIKDESGAALESRSMMFRWFLPQILKSETKWAEDYEKVKTPDEIAAYQKARKQFFLDAIGGLPERTPLNPRITGTVVKDGYKVEKVLFESQPNFLVSANLFLPDESKFAKPWPGVLIACGHSLNGKGYVNYQRVAALHALNGFAALIFDPIDQGERFQLVDRENKSQLAASVHAHNLVGIGSLLLGRNTARFEIWDGMRGIDYLQSRPDVDPDRIGACGLSGGGTQTAYFMALEERIDVAASLCYLTSLSAMLKMNKPQDAEQNIFGQSAFIMEHADYCIMRAPKPTMIGSATKDFFPIKETWDSYRYSKRMFELLGYGERMNLSETFNTHGYDKRLREATVRFMQRFLLGHNEAVTGPNVVEPVFEPERVLELTEDELRVTESGFTVLEPNSRTTYDLNRDYAAELTAQRPEVQKQLGEDGLKNRIRELAKFRTADQVPALTVLSEENVEKADALNLAEAKKIVFQIEEGLYMPAYWLVPKSKSESGAAENNSAAKEAVLYLNDKGKSADPAAIEKLIADGKSVLAVDLRGYGETQQVGQNYYKNENFGGDGQDFYTAYDLGKTYVGYRVEDLYNLVRWLKSDRKVDSVACLAVGETSIPALHAVFCDPDQIRHLTVDNTLVSWTNVVENGGFSTTPLTSTVHAALTVYDLPDLRAALEKAGKLTVNSIRVEKQ